MRNGLVRVVLWALIGAALGVACLLALAPAADLTFAMDRDLPPRVLSGFFPVEFSGTDSYAWTAGRAQVNVPGVDRSVRWRCRVSFRGGRADASAQPDVALVADGETLAMRRATNDYQVIEGTTRSRPDQTALRLNIVASKTFVPGPGDARELGVQVNGFSCRPVTGRALAGRVLVAAAVGGAAFGAGFSALGLGTIAVLAGVLAVAIAQVYPLSLGFAPYLPYQDRVMWAAIWIALGAVMIARGVEWRQRVPLGSTARFAVAFSAAVLFLKLLALLHPAKPVIDALFHAHRLEYVLAGRYFFTQEMPGGVQFPYAIALYVFAAPWAALARDHVALLRVVVTASEAVAGALLCWAVLKTWREPVAAAAAIVLFHAVPGAYEVVGNANLTNAFGQSAAVAALAAAIALPLARAGWGQIAVVMLLSAVAFLSHVSTFALLGGTLTVLVVLNVWRGGTDGRAMARAIGIAGACAVLLSVALYYGRPEFFPAYKSVQGARTRELAPASTDASATVGEEQQRLTGGAVPVQSAPARVVTGLGLAAEVIGWPTLLLAAIGAWRIRVDSEATRLRLAVTAWALASIAFVLFGVIAPGGVGHQRQALEFIARAAYAGAPAAVILAGIAVAWAWRLHIAARIAAVAVVAFAFVEPVRVWWGWMH